MIAAPALALFGVRWHHLARGSQLHSERPHAAALDDEHTQAGMEESAEHSYEGEGVERAVGSRKAANVEQEKARGSHAATLKAAHQALRIPRVRYLEEYIRVERARAADDGVAYVDAHAAAAAACRKRLVEERRARADVAPNLERAFARLQQMQPAESRAPIVVHQVGCNEEHTSLQPGGKWAGRRRGTQPVL